LTTRHREGNMQAVEARTERVYYRDLREWLALVEG
jgi:hypothetical protein